MVFTHHARRFITTLGLVALVAGIGLVVAASARGANYYAISCWDPARPNKGVKWYTYVRNGYAADYASGGHINNTIWEYTDAGDSGVNWIEIGYTKGYGGANTLTWYWARQRPGKPYQDWDIDQPISAGNWYWLEIKYVSDDTWAVYVDGIFISGCSPTTPNSNVNCWRIDTGLEFTSPNSYMGTSFSDSAINKTMQYWRASEQTWYTGLHYDPGYTHHAGVLDDQYGAFKQWNSPNNWSNLHTWKVN